MKQGKGRFIFFAWLSKLDNSPFKSDFGEITQPFIYKATWIQGAAQLLLHPLLYNLKKRLQVFSRVVMCSGPSLHANYPDSIVNLQVFPAHNVPLVSHFAPQFYFVITRLRINEFRTGTLQYQVFSPTSIQ